MHHYNFSQATSWKCCKTKLIRLSPSHLLDAATLPGKMKCLLYYYSTSSKPTTNYWYKKVVCTFRVINNSKNVSRETMLKSVGRSKCLPLGWMHAEKWQCHWQIICCNYSLIQLAHCTHFYIPQQSGGYMFILFVCVSFCEQITEKVTSRYHWNLELRRGLLILTLAWKQTLPPSESDTSASIWL